MPRTSGSFKKGHKGAKPKGAVNRTTKEAKEILDQVLLGQVDNIKEALELLLKKDQARYLDACSKLFAYVLPKKTDITSGDETLKAAININVTTKDAATKVKAFMNGSKSG